MTSVSATPRPRGLYAVTDQRSGAGLIESVRTALQGGAALVQYRDKSNDHPRRYHDARALLECCRESGVPLIINDDVALCGEVGADGVHLGRDDLAPEIARKALGESALIGLSCYDRLPDAARAATANYLAFGAVFPSSTKPQTPQASLALVREARARFPRHAICAIGGITPQNAAEVVAAGADLIAVVSALFGAADIESVARTMSDLFRPEAQ